MATANDIYQSLVIQNDGEAIDTNDTNNRTSIVLARMFDQLMERLAPGSLEDPDFNNEQAATSSTLEETDVLSYFAYALTGASACFEVGSTPNAVRICAGTLFQKLAPSTGALPQFLSFTFDGTTQLTLTNGDPSNPRVDIIQMSLAYADSNPQSRDFMDAVTGAPSTESGILKTRSVQCTIQVKAGTPAGTPICPLPDAGFVTIAAIVVPTAYAWASAWTIDDTIASRAYLFDQRMPLGISSPLVMPIQYQYNTGSWALNGSTGQILSSAAGGSGGAFAVPCLHGGGHARILGVDLEQLVMGSASTWWLGPRAGSTVKLGNASPIGASGFSGLIGTTEARFGITANDPGAGYAGSCPQWIPVYGSGRMVMWSNGKRGAERFWLANTGAGSGLLGNHKISTGKIPVAWLYSTDYPVSCEIGMARWYLAGA